MNRINVTPAISLVTETTVVAVVFVKRIKEECKCSLNFLNFNFVYPKYTWLQYI